MTDAPDLVTDAELERRFTYRPPKGDQPARYSQIEPALTPEEWEKLFSEGNDGELERERFSIWRYDAGDPFPVEVRIRSVEEEEHEYTSSGRKVEYASLYGQELHALAALALYGQRFGFTHEDVRILRDLAEELVRDDLHDLADRIEALLPPREPARG